MCLDEFLTHLVQALARGLQRGDLTPVDPETNSWDAAGNTLREIFSSAAAWRKKHVF